jgi:hypothetical protein
MDFSAIFYFLIAFGVGALVPFKVGSKPPRTWHWPLVISLGVWLCFEIIGLADAMERGERLDLSLTLFSFLLMVAWGAAGSVAGVAVSRRRSRSDADS